ncbi:MAG: DUF5723 family protein [Bacteroidota bacterium]
MKKILIIALVILSGELFAQSNLGFFHMGGALPQGANYNPAYFPDARVYVSLPGISGIDLSVNNSFGISDILTETGDSTLIDINKFLGTQQKDKSFFNMNLAITDLMIGFRIGEKSYMSLFVNERIDATMFYPIDLMNFVWRGNAAYVGQNFVADKMGYSMTHYREWGIGYGRSFDILGRETTIGARFKYLNGMLHSSTEDFAISILTDDDYSLTATFNDAQIRQAGITQLEEDDFDASYFIFNGNGGFGFDLGARMQFTEKLGLGASINDLGFINWKENAEVISFTNTTFEYSGINLDNTDSFGEAITDSLDNIKSKTTETTFSTTLNGRTYFTADYLLASNGYAQATLANYFSQGRLKTSVGLGITQPVGKWFMASATTSYVPQQGVDLGLGLMFRLSSFQLYVAADNLFNSLNVPEASAANIKVGLNLLFGRSQKKSVKKVTPTPAVEAKDATSSTEIEDDYSHLWDSGKKKKK